MQTRRQKQVAKTDTHPEPQSALVEDQMVFDCSSEIINDEPMEEAVASVPGLSATPAETRRRLSEPKPAAASPKRVKTKSSASPESSMLQKYVRTVEIPHSDILTTVVWVFDEKYQWWPGKVQALH